MAVSLGSQSLDVASQRRTWRLTVETPFQQDYVLTANRELIRMVDDTILSKSNTATVIRTLSATVSDQVTLQSGKTINVAELAEAFAALVDMWEAEDAE